MTTMAGGHNQPDTVPWPRAGLYRGTVMHARLIAPLHRFTYRVLSLMCDLDDLKTLDGKSRLFSVDRFNLFSFHQADHGPRDGTPLRRFVDGELQKAGVERPSRVMLLSFPRILGYAFNPIAIYYCYDGAGRISALMYQVRNTFGEGHIYVAPVEQEDHKGPVIRQARNKIFFVSPFLDMQKRYHFRIQPPGETLRVRIFEADANGPVLAATQAGEWQPLSSRTLISALVAMPFSMLSVIAGIHFEAVKLWLRGARYHTRDAPPAPVSHADMAQSHFAARSSSSCHRRSLPAK